MAISEEEKASTVASFQKHPGDTGSAQVQVALITARLKDLQEHFKSHMKDHHSRRGLLKLVGRRRSLLSYIKGRDVTEYRQLIEKLGIRK